MLGVLQNCLLRLHANPHLLSICAGDYASSLIKLPKLPTKISSCNYSCADRWRNGKQESNETCRADNLPCEEKFKELCGSLNLTQPVCQPAKHHEESKVRPKARSMWKGIESYQIECDYDRADLRHYHITDKSKLQYAQTWVECPPPKQLPKILCCLDVQWPKAKPRPPLCAPPPARPCSSKNIRCPTITMPCCRPARSPPKCFLARKLSNCNKVKCPYPSYSECTKDKVSSWRPVECGCLSDVPICEFYRALRRLQLMRR